MAAMLPESLELIVHHVVLPPKLPQKAEDPQISQVAERDLIGLLSTQLTIYRFKDDRKSSSIRSVWVGVEEMLNRCKPLISTHALSADSLLRAFSTLMPSRESGDMLLQDLN